MEIDDIGNLCLWCMQEMGSSAQCPHCGHNEQESMHTELAIPEGEILNGHFLLGRTLGQGGFGITYLAYDLDLHVKRAIKEYFPIGLVTREGKNVKVIQQSMTESYQKGVNSFYKEAQAVACFSGHPNVVQVHALFRENRTAYFVMDYVDGISFQQYLNENGGKISWEKTLQILKPIGEALSALHESHLLHRDVKPDNIFITRNGTPKLLDFGAARYETSQFTHNSAAVLTPGYAPAEQYGSISTQGPFTDVYALAATFYRAISGITLVPATDRMQTDSLLPLCEVNSEVPAAISAALNHGLSVKSADRTQTIAQFLNELEDNQPQSKLPIPEIHTSETISIQNDPQKTLNAFISWNSNTPENDPEKTLNIFSEGNKPNDSQKTIDPTQVSSASSPNSEEPLLKETVLSQDKHHSINILLFSALVIIAIATGIWTLKTNSLRQEETAPSVVQEKDDITKEIQNAQTGDHVFYGHYEQDNDHSNGTEAIEWRVLKREGNRLLLLSEYGLEMNKYHETYQYMTWENSSLRKWLNEEFYQNSFTDKEKSYIALSDVKAEKNPNWDADPGNDTKDNVFLLSIKDIDLYFQENAERICFNTPAIAANPSYSSEFSDGAGKWWLRSSGDGYLSAAFVNEDGSVSSTGKAVSTESMVRPVFWMDIESAK